MSIKSPSHSAIVLLFMVLPLLAGCQNTEDAPEDASEEQIQQQEPSQEIPDINLTAKLIELARPNQYNVEIALNLSTPSKNEWILQRENQSDGVKHMAVLGPENHNYKDMTVASGETYNYILKTMETAEAETRANAIITIPKDLLASGVEYLEKITGIHRLFIEKDTVIMPRGTLLSIKVNEIISDGGTITSFPPNTNAAIGGNGRNGGNISIVADRASGKLNVIARGEAGGNGSPGLLGYAGKAGAPGSNAEIGYNDSYSSLLQISLFNSNAFREMIDKRINEDPTGTIARRYIKCYKPPTSGAPGEPGGPGSNGYPGGDGGSSGLLYINIKYTDQLKPTTKFYAGEPGLGGAAGKGGPGGPPGASGQQDKWNICPPAPPQGPPGSPGPDGLPGPNGKAGNLEPYCIILGKDVKGDCDKFNSNWRNSIKVN